MTRSGQRRRPNPSRWFALLGTLTIVVIAAIGYVAYRANFGLPWDSRYELNVEVPDADRLIGGADVRIGGVLVGEVLSASAEPAAHGAPPYAKLKLALNTSVGPLPADSTVQVRPESVLGLTYVDVYPGHSRRTIPAGGTLALSQARPASDLTDLLGIFDRASSQSFQRALAGLAYGVAGRGTAINATIGSINELLPDVSSIASELAAPQTLLGGSLRAYENLASELAPVGAQLADLTSNAAQTMGALADVRPALGAAIDAAPGAESATTLAFTRAAPALDGLAQLAIELRPGGALLGGAVDDVDAAMSAGVAPLQQLPAFAGRLHSALDAIGGLARDRSANGALRKLHDLIVPTNQVLSVLLPAQIDCNLLGPWSQNFGSMWGALGVGQGPALANLVLTSPGADGEELQNDKPSPNVAMNPLPIENASECQSGNEPWTGHQVLNNPGRTGRTTRSTVPPPGVTALARKAGLLAPIAGVR
jgi:virulence factor Mce-like protein